MTGRPRPDAIIALTHHRALKEGFLALFRCLS